MINGRDKGWRTLYTNPKHYKMTDNDFECFMQGLFTYRNMQGVDGIKVLVLLSIDTSKLQYNILKKRERHLFKKYTRITK